MSIRAYIELCNRYGAHISDVQWPGWNVSVKNPEVDIDTVTPDEDTQLKDIVLIKASGTLMKDVGADMTGAYVAYAWLPKFMQERKEHALTQTLEDELNIEVKWLTRSELRPSMETAMHALIPWRYIVHTHHVYANIFLTAEEGRAMLQKRNIEFGWIPIAVPGMNLAQEIAKAYPSSAPKILFLENHGIVIADDEPESLMRTYDGLTENLLAFLWENDIPPMPQNYSIKEVDEATYTIEMTPGAAKSFADMSYLSKKYIYPDAAVFGQTLDLSKVRLEWSQITITWYSQKQATNILENIAAINYILYAHEKLWLTTRALPQRVIDYMAEMEAEKFRKSLNQK